MEKRAFGKLGDISCLTLGGGGIGQVWGPTSRDEAVATVSEAVDAGITFLDVAPAYGRGEAELVIGAAFNGRLPDGVRLSTKCMLGNPPRQEVLSRLERSLDKSLARTKLKRIDLFFLHGQIVPDTMAGQAEGTPRGLFVEVVRPAFEQLVAQGRIGAWGISGVGVPTNILETINEDPPPAAVQAVANLLDSVGAMKRFDEPARPREIIAAAHRRDIAVMGIRAVQAGALTDALDRELPETHPEMVDYRRAAPFPRSGQRSRRISGRARPSLRALDPGRGHRNPRSQESRGVARMSCGRRARPARSRARRPHRRGGRQTLAGRALDQAMPAGSFYPASGLKGDRSSFLNCKDGRIWQR